MIEQTLFEAPAHETIHDIHKGLYPNQDAGCLSQTLLKRKGKSAHIENGRGTFRFAGGASLADLGRYIWRNQWQH